jgi:hypothetical protein
MTLEEYERIIGNDLVAAHNHKDVGALMATFKRADQTLENSNIGPADRKEFWEEVRKVVYSGGLLLERQANSALIVLMQSIEREIAARIGKAK